MITGMHCNNWMPLLLQQLIQNKITPIVIYDLIDVQYSYLSQREIFHTHNDANNNFISFLLSKNVLLVNHFDILSQYFKTKCPITKIEYDLNTNSSHYIPYYQT